MKISMITIDGKKAEDIEISENIFSQKPNKAVVNTVLDWQISMSKKRTAKTKQRNEIKGSTSKIYAQKGTGGARHSSRKAPLFVGGGIAHGPKGNVYRDKKVNKKVKKLALINVLSDKNRKKNIIVVDDIKKKINKTKEFNSFLIKNKINNILFIVDKDTKKNIELSARNIPNLKIIDQNGTNVYDIIKYQYILFTKTSLNFVQGRLSK